MATISGTLTEANPISTELTLTTGETGVRVFVDDVKDASPKLQVNPAGLGEWYDYVTYPIEDLPAEQARPLIKEGDIVRLNLRERGSHVDAQAVYHLETV